MDGPLLRHLYALLPVIPGGVMNMIFVKRRWLAGLSGPIDGGIVLSDGRRLLGSNKTWKGLAGMVVFTALWAALLRIYPDGNGVFHPAADAAGIARQCGYGAVLGLFYILAELPNSFIKRRLDIAPGRNASGIRGILFTIVDQADSVIGCALAISFFTPMSLADFWMLVLIASAIHYAINVLLYLARLKSQAR